MTPDEITAELQPADLPPGETPRQAPEIHLAVQFAAKTDLGRVRENNEDKFDWWEPEDPVLLANRGRLYAVADGMGGHAAGQIASEMALKALAQAYFGGVNGSVEDAVARAFSQANAVIYDTARAIPSRSGMGCTLATVAIVDSDAVVAWAGDSRAYLIRDGIATQMTRDHSLVEEHVQLGILTREEAAHHPRRNIITRSLGPEPAVQPDVVRYPLLPGDTLLLCSDGLTGVVADPEIAALAVASPPSLACGELIGVANSRGGPDNVTVAILRVLDDSGQVQPSEAAPDPPAARRRGFFHRAGS
ncbi:MAG TPA: Stp1/IreP family PP2C-type Ser/Thr phosphatase [Armatimonadota bacterium]|jgi:protein phosphatase